MDEIRLTPQQDTKVYPAIEELVIRAVIKNPEQGLELLKCLQALVNEVGTDTIIGLVRKLEKDPSLMQKAQKYLPYLNML